MPFTSNIADREYDKFFKRNNKTYVRVGDDGNGAGELTTLNVSKVTVTDTETKITTPEGAGEFFINHRSNSTVYVGSIGITTSTGFPVDKNDTLRFSEFKLNNENEIYAICETGASVDIFVVASVKE